MTKDRHVLRTLRNVAWFSLLNGPRGRRDSPAQWNLYRNVEVHTRGSHRPGVWKKNICFCLCQEMGSEAISSDFKVKPDPNKEEIVAN